MHLRQLILAASGAMAISALAVAGCVAAAAGAPPFVTRGMPAEGQKAMEPLAGDWKVTMTVYIAMGSPEHPVTSNDLVAHREWIAGGRFLRDVTEGTIGGSPYWRMATLGYSNMDGRYEWVTQDAFNANMMIYQGAAMPARTFPPVFPALSPTRASSASAMPARRSGSAR